jgi:hypothetical protein
MAKPPKITSSTDIEPSPDTPRRFDATDKQNAVALSGITGRFLGGRSCLGWWKYNRVLVESMG